MNLGQWTQEVAAHLTSEAAGVHIAADPRDVRVPGGIVHPSTARADRLDADTYTVEWRVVLLSSAATPQALDELGRMATHIESIHNGTTWEAVTITDPNLSADPIPALTATITTECED